jgi:hypothetical protein
MFLIGLLTLAAIIYPTWKILERMGFNGAWSLISIIPLGAIIGLWVLAFQPWPAGGKAPNA